jgi:DNA-binding transcriptional LysR family regulator
MDLVDLLIFKTVADEGGISKAAHKLHRAPSSVTTRIQQLEASIGVTLFNRQRQRLQLSATGRLFLEYADKLIRLSDEARAVISSEKPKGVLRLGALESTAASRLPHVLADLHRRYPEIRVKLTTGTNDALVSKVLDRQLDAAFIAEAPVALTLECIPVFQERLIVISSLSHRPIRRARDVDGASLIAFPEGCAYRRVLLRWLGRESLGMLRTLELSSYYAIVACVASGVGIALIPESVLDTIPNARVLRHSIPKSQNHIVTPLVWRRSEVSPPVLALRTLLSPPAKQIEAGTEHGRGPS